MKTIYKVEKVDSFFNFFTDCEAKKDGKFPAEKNKEEDSDEEGEEEDEQYAEEEYELGVFVKDELVPYCLEYYLGIVDDEDDGFDDKDDDEEDFD